MRKVRLIYLVGSGLMGVGLFAVPIYLTGYFLAKHNQATHWAMRSILFQHYLSQIAGWAFIISPITTILIAYSLTRRMALNPLSRVMLSILGLVGMLLFSCLLDFVVPLFDTRTETLVFGLVLSTCYIVAGGTLLTLMTRRYFQLVA